MARLNKAKSAMENRDILVEKCYDEIEGNLDLLVPLPLRINYKMVYRAIAI